MRNPFDESARDYEREMKRWKPIIGILLAIIVIMLWAELVSC